MELDRGPSGASRLIMSDPYWIVEESCCSELDHLEPECQLHHHLSGTSLQTLHLFSRESARDDVCDIKRRKLAGETRVTLR